MALLVLALWCGLAVPVFGHVVPKDQFDRKIKVRLIRTGKDTVQIRIEYVLEVDELTATKTLVLNYGDEINVDDATDKRQAFYSLFTKKFGPLYADNVSVKVADREIPVKLLRHSHRLTDDEGQALGHLRCEFEFEGTATAEPGKEYSCSFEENNFRFPSPKTGMIDLTWLADPSVPLQEIDQPDVKLKQLPLTELGPGDEQKLRHGSAKFTLPREEVKSASTEEETRLKADGHAQHKPLFDLFFSSGYAVWVLLILATLFGAVHALTPGHGKTLVAAYLVGEHGTVLHALVLGLVTTLTHTGAVLVVAIALWFVPEEEEEVKSALQGVELTFGILIVCLGVWLLLRRLSGRADHVHLGGGHHHHHGGHHHDHVHADHVHDGDGNIIPRTAGQHSVGIWQLVLLGMQGGIVPCWDAVIMLCAAIAANLLWLALPLLLAFSLGLATVLVAVGIAVVYSKRFAESRWGESRLIRSLPVISACIVIGLGFWLCYGGVHGG
jgi:ABC-type nickel/cobalt efflux system permease component RcnA